jgi:diacylglycerol kinase family enzyme
MRAILVTNPAASTSAGWTREVVVRALQSELDLTVMHTEHRGHATDIAHAAREDGVELILTLGGDGTVNEVINGMLRESAQPLPLLGTIPGGLANVFPRSLGFTSDAMAAAGQLLEGLARNSYRTIPLGKFNDRWFAFNAGLGFDAGIIEAVEAQRAEGHRASPGLYLLTGIKHYLESREGPHITVTDHNGNVVDGIYMVVVQNTSPWVFAGPIPFDFAPHASYDRGLDLVALTSMSPTSLATYMAESAAGVELAKRTNCKSIENFDWVKITSDRPLPAQVDGDALGNVDEVIVTAVPDAIRVIVPVDAN